MTIISVAKWASASWFILSVTHLPSSSPYFLTVQALNLLIRCVYLLPILLVDEPTEILGSLPIQNHPFQQNAIICGNFNARHRELLDDTATIPHGTALNNWIIKNGLRS
ncbi:hypothetical protein RMATCC62417_14650 [Rhizopus microsporus]|nr:hypothetical protein RMATCC62417_14650 [Rhizopus microsporus]